MIILYYVFVVAMYQCYIYLPVESWYLLSGDKLLYEVTEIAVIYSVAVLLELTSCTLKLGYTDRRNARLMLLIMTLL